MNCSIVPGQKTIGIRPDTSTALTAGAPSSHDHSPRRASQFHASNDLDFPTIANSHLRPLSYALSFPFPFCHRLLPSNITAPSSSPCGPFHPVSPLTSTHW